MNDSAAWESLTRELDLWAAETRTATFWWRDDDANRRPLPSALCVPAPMPSASR